MLILASTSRYRRELLQRLGLAFESVAPDVDESPRVGETPWQLCRRLSEAKARIVAASHPEAIVIGSDQSADLDGEIIGKPLQREASKRQFARASGKDLLFHTGLCVMRASDDRVAVQVETTRVRFRSLDGAMIDRYLDRESALDCAGGFKCEGLGIALFDAIESSDPTALIGLPLIALRRMLAVFGVDPLG